jgi:hypothetical protein
MATDIPRQIVVSDRVMTRLGPLNSVDGFPDLATTERVYDHLDFQRAVQAVLTTLPAASLAAMRAGLASIGVGAGAVALFDALLDSRSLLLTANTESVYLASWLDLRAGPLVVETPPNVLGFVDDAWSHWVADLGNAGPDRGKGGKFLFLPPDHAGAEPAGHFVSRCPTFGNWLVLRGFMVSGDPKPAAERMRRHFRVYPLARASDPPATTFISASGRAVSTIPALDLSFFAAVHRVVQEEPPAAIDPETLGLLAAIGIEKGRPFAPDRRMTKILVEAATVADATSRALLFRPRDRAGFLYPDSAWMHPRPSHTFEHDGVRELDARAALSFYATGVTPAMRRERVGIGAQYAFAFTDAAKRRLDGGRSYRLHLPAGIPAKDFWSLVVYDNQTRSELQTDQQFPSISSQRPGVTRNADRSLDVYFGPRPPRGREGNWIQTRPGKGWNVVLRLYGPLQSFFDRTWRPGEIEDLSEAAEAATAPAAPAAASAPPRMATPVPPAISIRDRLETRIGILRFRDGFPDDATVAKVYDNLDFQRAVQAFLTTMPAASLSAMRKGLRGFGPANQTVLVFENRIDSRSLFLTASPDSVDALAWLDLRKGPIVIESPPGSVGVVDDFWFRWVADLGPDGPDQGRGGKFLFLPPDHRGSPPPGYFAFRSRTFNGLFILRGVPVNGDPRPGAAAIKQHLRIYPLARASSRPTTSFINASGKAFNTIHAMDVSFYNEVNEVVQDEPAGAMDPETLGLLAAIGIEKGKRFAPDARLTKILIEAAAVAGATARALAFRSRLAEAPLYPRSAWETPLVGGSAEFLRAGARFLDARSFFSFLATGITPALAARRIGAGSQDAVAFVDAKGQPLDGARSYRLHLPAGIPARESWSLVVHDNQTRSGLQTDQQFPSLGSQTPGVAVDPDGSVDVYFGPEAPPGREGNWVQTWPGKGWNVALRLEGPLEPFFDKSWRPSEIEPLDPQAEAGTPG